MSETVFEISGNQYDVIKRGKAQAEQVASASRWLARYGKPVFAKLSDQGMESMGGVELIINVLGALDTDALIGLFQMTFGCTNAVADEAFDLMALVDGITALYQNSPVIRRLADRFFSVPRSVSIEDASFTPSESPTDI